jgi:hypothetical protein
MLDLSIVPYGAGLVAGKAYKNYTPHEFNPALCGGDGFCRRPGPDIDAGFAGSGPSLRFEGGYFFDFGLGITAFFRMQFLRGENEGWDDAFDLFSAGVRINYMAVKKKLVYLNIFLGGGYGHYRHKIADVPNPFLDPTENWITESWTVGSYPPTWPACSAADVKNYIPCKGQRIDFWRAAGLFDLSAGLKLIIRPVDVFGITIGLNIDALLPTFALNFDASVGVAFFFGNGFREGKKKAPAEPTFQDPMMY